MPVIVLSARTDSVDKVEALDLGADDYVTKPFAMDELLARVRVALRRTPGRRQVVRSPPVRTPHFALDFAERRAVAGGSEVRLTPTEWSLLEVLARRPGHLVSQRDLLREVWGPGYGRESNYLRVYANQLRRKLEPDPAEPALPRDRAGPGLPADARPVRRGPGRRLASTPWRGRGSAPWTGESSRRAASMPSPTTSTTSRSGFWAVVLTFEGDLTAVRMSGCRAGRRATAARLRRPGWPGVAGEWTASLDDTAYVEGVEEVRERIARGTVYQVNLCRVLEHRGRPT